MSILSKLFGSSPSAGPPAWDDFWYNSVGTLTTAGIRVTADTAFNVSAVYAAVRIVSETVAQIPLIIYRRTANGGKERAENHPLFSLLHDQPNPWQTSFEWREMMMSHIALRGNAYNEIIPGPRGAVDQLIPLNPDRIKIEQLETGRLIYEYTPVNGPKRRLNQDDVFHLKGLSSDGLMGISTLTLMRESIGLALATEKYGAGLFTSDGAIRGVLKHPGQLTPEGRKNLKDSFSKGASGGTALLEEGLSWEKIGMTAEDAQFLMTRKFQINEFARWFNVPPHMLRDLDKSSFSNIEQQAIDFVSYSMMPWFRRWEQAITRDLILAPQTFFAEFEVKGLLRGDVKTRNDAYAIAITNGWMTRNEVRILENLNPLPGLDIPLAQANMNPVVGKYRRLVKSAAARVVKKETSHVRTAYKRMTEWKTNYGGLKEWVSEFYSSFPLLASEALGISLSHFLTYTDRHEKELITAIEKESHREICSVLNLVKQWEKSAAEELTELVLEVMEDDNDSGEEISSPDRGGQTNALGDHGGETKRDNRTSPSSY